MYVLEKKQPGRGLTLSKADKPRYGDEDVLIKIKKTGICGTDLHIYNWDLWAQKTIPIPMHIGHEFCGEVVAVGKNVSKVQIGDRVTGEGHITCGKCRVCQLGRIHLCPSTIGLGIHRPGCFAEFLSLPASNVFKMPDDIDESIASILDPFGNAVHAVFSFGTVEKDVLITGAGPIGIMAAAICRHIGVRHILMTDMNHYRLNLAQKMGASIAINIGNYDAEKDTINLINEEIKKKHIHEGLGMGLEMSGSAMAVNTLLSCINHGGKAALLGICGQDMLINFNQIVFKGLMLKGIYGREVETWNKMIQLIQSGLDLKPIITHQFHYTDYEQAFELMDSKQCGKVILNWNN